MTVALLQGVIDPTGNIRRLLSQRHNDTHRVGVNAVVLVDIPDAPHPLPGDVLDVDFRLGGHLTGYVHQTRGRQRLHSHTGHRVLGQIGIQNGV
ncbi:MAG: Uncharacterised protein [Cellulomonadaceae bacterium TMED98]|nr:MAG: Uncharacterised protein [Cellulomonadaceae bacterium TMED98]